MFSWGTSCAAEPSRAVAQALDALGKLHQLSEVAVFPDGKRVIYVDMVTGKRGDASVDVSALWMVFALNGSELVRVTACPGKVRDEHGPTWSPNGAQSPLSSQC
jgi:WD40-like Beta Propeller Repeat